MTTPAERIKEERIKLGMTQESFGQIMGISTRTQQNYESGVRNPDIPYLEALSKHGININYVVTGVRLPTEDLQIELNLILDAYSVIEEKLGDRGLTESEKRKLAFALYELYKETDSKSEKLADTVLKLVMNG